MRSLKATSQLTRLCEHLPVKLDAQTFLRHDSHMTVPICEDTLERRWQSYLPGAPPSAPGLPAVAHPQTALALQLDRAKVATESARVGATVATSTDKLLLNAMATCHHDLTMLFDSCVALSHLAPVHPAWHTLLDQAYAVGKAMDGAMQRLDMTYCNSIVMDLMARSRGQFGHHEVYALAAVLEHIPGHTLACADLRKRLHDAHLRSRRAQATDIKPHLTAEDKAAVRAFLAHPMVNAVLEDAHRLKHDTVKARCNSDPDYAFTPLAQAVQERRASEAQQRALATALQDTRNKRDALLVRSHQGLPKVCAREVDPFLRSRAGRALSAEWDAVNQALAQLMLQPQDHARYLAENTLREQFESMITVTDIADVKQLFAKPFQVPEALYLDVQALYARASNRAMSTGLRESLREVGRKISALYNEATDSNSIAMELAFVLDERTQEALHALRQRLNTLSSAIDMRPLQAKKTRKRGAKSDPQASSPAKEQHAAASSLSTALEAGAFDSDQELEAEEEAAESQQAPEPSAPKPETVQGAQAAETAGAAPMRMLRVNGRPTPLRTRLSDAEALALIDRAMAQGTFSSPLRSAIYHYRRHVPRVGTDQAALPQPTATIEEYLGAAQRRFAEWDRHTVTHGRGDGEMLAYVEQRPRGWFTRDGKVVSFCYEDT